MAFRTLTVPLGPSPPDTPACPRAPRLRPATLLPSWGLPFPQPWPWVCPHPGSHTGTQSDPHPIPGLGSPLPPGSGSNSPAKSCPPAGRTLLQLTRTQTSKEQRKRGRKESRPCRLMSQVLQDSVFPAGSLLPPSECVFPTPLPPGLPSCQATAPTDDPAHAPFWVPDLMTHSPRSPSPASPYPLWVCGHQP